ncbi:MAG: cytochrome c3 family protein, partial [Phycisphaeraceae bacterium]
QPDQPVAFSHEIHVTQLGMDCRYCHTTVEEASFAAIPATSTCMNCHHAVDEGSRTGSREDVSRIQQAFESGNPIEWTRVHDVADYAYFDHSIHVNAGVSCVSCHGRVDRMDGGRNRVHQVKPLSMGWCLDCHRNPEEHLRPADEVTNLMWGLDQTEEQRLELGHQLAEEIGLRTPRQMVDCSSCHR